MKVQSTTRRRSSHAAASRTAWADCGKGAQRTKEVGELWFVGAAPLPPAVTLAGPGCQQHGLPPWPAGLTGSGAVPGLWPLLLASGQSLWLHGVLAADRHASAVAYVPGPPLRLAVCLAPVVVHGLDLLLQASELWGFVY
ncbi:hypothetical protein HaLaN_31814 [Haematococcus lacustris]|uniref:Uncharacterized protein n=1 Tax=Haematococcus lacustris TaxID=44745 RepID=A0A6A0AJY9_HAELA|nr:hypothetical protein HaLaN_31814 [Haematococcus lacustris]